MSSHVLDQLDSPAAALMEELETTGFTLGIVGGRLRVSPGSRLMTHHIGRIRRYRTTLRALVGAADATTQARMTLFARQWSTTPSDQIPAFLVCPDLPYEPVAVSRAVMTWKSRGMGAAGAVRSRGGCP